MAKVATGEISDQFYPEVPQPGGSQTANDTQSGEAMSAWDDILVEVNAFDDDYESDQRDYNSQNDQIGLMASPEYSSSDEDDCGLRTESSTSDTNFSASSDYQQRRRGGNSKGKSAANRFADS